MRLFLAMIAGLTDSRFLAPTLLQGGGFSKEEECMKPI
jgi:hypothetical protein